MDTTTIIIIGITGTFGAGKDTLVEYLVSHYGFVTVSFRDFFIEKMTKEGLETNRDAMIEYANRLREEKGGDYIIKLLLEEAKELGPKIVFGSIRCPIEADFLLNYPNAFLASVDADQRVRYDRVVIRGSSTDKISFEDFCRQEKKEMSNTDPNKQNLGYCMSKTPEFLKFKNDSDPESFRKQIDSAMKHLNSFM